MRLLAEWLRGRSAKGWLGMRLDIFCSGRVGKGTIKGTAEQVFDATKSILEGLDNPRRGLPAMRAVEDLCDSANKRDGLPHGDQHQPFDSHRALDRLSRQPKMD